MFVYTLLRAWSFGLGLIRYLLMCKDSCQQNGHQIRRTWMIRCLAFAETRMIPNIIASVLLICLVDK